MKRLLLTLLTSALFAATARAATPNVVLRLDTMRTDKEYTMPSVFVNDAPVFRVYWYENGAAWTDTGWDGNLWYGTNGLDSTSLVLIPGTPSGNYMDFVATSVSFPSDGTFVSGVTITNTTSGLKKTWGWGKIRVRKSPGAGSSSALVPTDSVDATYTDWTGTFDGQEGSYYLDGANITNLTLAGDVTGAHDANTVAKIRGVSVTNDASPTDDYILKYDSALGLLNWEADTGGLGSGSMTTVKTNGTQLGGADIVTLDYSSEFSLTESPDTEINIAIGSAIARDSEVTTATSTLHTAVSAEIDSDITTHAGAADPHADRSYADGLVDDLSGVSDAATSRTNLGLVAGGAGDIWVEKAGDTMTGQLTMDDSIPIAWSGGQSLYGSGTEIQLADAETEAIVRGDSSGRYLANGGGTNVLDFSDASINWINITSMGFGGATLSNATYYGDGSGLTNLTYSAGGTILGQLTTSDIAWIGPFYSAVTLANFKGQTSAGTANAQMVVKGKAAAWSATTNINGNLNLSTTLLEDNTWTDSSIAAGEMIGFSITNVTGATSVWFSVEITR